MTGRRQRSSRTVSDGGGRTGARLLVLLVVLALGAVAVVRYDLYDRWFGSDVAAPADPAEVPPPSGIALPDVTAPPLVAHPATDDGAALDPVAVRAAVRPLLRDPDVGRHVRIAVAPLDGGRPLLLGRGNAGDAIPASTTKLVTTTAALLSLGPDHRFSTRVVRTGSRLVLVGGGDPFLRSKPDDDLYPQSGDLQTLARGTARSLRTAGVGRVSLDYDTSLFSGPAVNPEWESGYVPDVASPVESLWVDEGRDDLSADPADAAADAFARALRKQGVKVTGEPRPRTAPSGATEVASVPSAPVEQIVERILLVSDNNAAEVLLRQIGLAESGTGSAPAGRRAVERLLTGAGVDLHDTVLYDGSGLSRHDRMDPRTLLDVLRLAASDDHPELRAVVTGLPVAGFTGSLASRMDHGPQAGLGRVRAKTGTLSNVQALAGIATDLEDRPLVFALMLDRIRLPQTLQARETLDDTAAALGACSCTL